MHRNRLAVILLAGIVGGFVGNGVLGALFTSAPIHALLYNPAWQSPLFMEITLQRDLLLGSLVEGVVIAFLLGRTANPK